MELRKILEYSKKPALYDKGTEVMWTDPYISGQLLQIHLNPDIDLASRSRPLIEKTADWILSNLPADGMKILDLGCGPGLYTEIYAKAGHQVTGVDFSEVSIAYAKEEAKNKGLGIEYYRQNYLELNVAGQFDLVTLIYTDLGVLNPEERAKLLEKVKAVLKPGGIFIFDVLNDKYLEEKVSPRSWEIAEGGFWRKGVYLALADSLLYKDEKVVLSQHTVIEEKRTEVYRFWTHFFSHDDLKEIILGAGFKKPTFHEDILPAKDIWSGDNVTFCITYDQ